MRGRIVVAIAAIGGIAAAVALALAPDAETVPPADDTREERADELEARGAEALDAGRTDEARVYLAAAYELSDRVSVRFLLARAQGAHGPRGTLAHPGDLVSLSPDGALLAIASGTELAVWTTQPVSRTGRLALSSPAFALAWNPAEPTQLVVAGEDGAQFYDVTRGRASLIEGAAGGIEALTWGTRARASIRQGDAYALADLSPPRETLALAARPLAIAPRHALVCGEDACDLVSTDGDIEIPVAARLASFADDRVAIAAADGVYVVDLLGRELARLSEQATAVALSGDGTRLATTAARTDLWDATTGTHLETVEGKLAAISRDGTWLAVRRGDDLALWALPLETRKSAAISAEVRCRVPLALVDSKLVATPVHCAK